MPRKKEQQTQVLPLIPLRDVVVYPNMVIPLFVGRESSIQALETALMSDKQLFLAAQKDGKNENPSTGDLHEDGVIATILQVLRLPDGTIKVLVEGGQPAKLIGEPGDTELPVVQVALLELHDDVKKLEARSMVRALQEQFESLVNVSRKIPGEVVAALSEIQELGRLVYGIAAHLSVTMEAKQKLLTIGSLKERVVLLQQLMEEDKEVLELDKKLQVRVKGQVEKNQKQYYLNEKLKAIQYELGELGDVEVGDINSLQKKIDAAGMPEEVKEKAQDELKKLKQMPASSAESAVSRNYLDTLLAVPWKKTSKLNLDLKKAKKVLDKDHFGLEKVKDRVLEYLAVQQRVKKIKGPILCLVGAPGVGKTSLGKSIAKATGRVYERIALGGVRDEAEIRGHRRTYIGALPGKIIQKVSKAGVKNPLILLDEVDKMAADFRGDPASALLEVLDPEQNHTFNDHYLEVDYDLSDVMFVATANSMDIPAPLLDRMEVINLSGYTEEEKMEIAENYLLPRQLERNGVKKGELTLSTGAVKEIIQTYTREAGVRRLEQEIAKVCRKVVKALLLCKGKSKINVSQRNLEKYLGVKKYRFGLAEENNQVGQVTGLAWTSVGGDTLSLEVQMVPGKGKSQYTGSLGDVMQESIQAAMTVMRSRLATFGVTNEFYQKHDYHVHVPEGATPKDGPSAGIGMCTALVSAITKIPVRAEVAMTGEITLRGEVLPIGGLKEKLLAALRAGIKVAIIPKENERDLKDLPKVVLQGLEIHPVRWIDEVLNLALERQPEPLKEPLPDMPMVNVGKKKDEAVAAV